MDCKKLFSEENLQKNSVNYTFMNIKFLVVVVNYMIIVLRSRGGMHEGQVYVFDVLHDIG